MKLKFISIIYNIDVFIIVAKHTSFDAKTNILWSYKHHMLMIVF